MRKNCSLFSKIFWNIFTLSFIKILVFPCLSYSNELKEIKFVEKYKKRAFCVMEATNHMNYSPDTAMVPFYQFQIYNEPAKKLTIFTVDELAKNMHSDLKPTKLVQKYKIEKSKSLMSVGGAFISFGIASSAIIRDDELTARPPIFALVSAALIFTGIAFDAISVESIRKAIKKHNVIISN